MATHARGRRSASRWTALRLLWLVFLVAGLMAVSVVDADGDPSTTNMPSVVLSADTRLPAKDDTCQARSNPETRVDAKRSTWLRRRTHRCPAGGESQLRWHPRVRPIRGP